MFNEHFQFFLPFLLQTLPHSYVYGENYT